MLASIEEIVEKSLPLTKLTIHFQDPQAAKLCILIKIAFCEARQKVFFLVNVVKNMLSGFELLSHKVSFQKENWNKPKLDLPLPRSNMPHIKQSLGKVLQAVVLVSFFQ